MTIDPQTTAVEHLNRVVSLSDLTLPPLLTAIPDAALFLLRSHREDGTQIRQSVYDYAISVEAMQNVQ
jgi:hypothetical protein